MGIVDSMKQALEKLSGEAQRKEQQRLAQEAEIKEQARLTAEQAERSRFAAAQGSPVGQAAEKAKRQEAMRKQQDRQVPAPGNRLFAGRDMERQLRDARARPSDPQPAQEAAKTPTQVAEQMQYRPAGHQRGPSPGGGNYVNPRVAQPRQEAAPKAIEPAPRECLADQIERKMRERDAGMTVQQREAERSARQKTLRREDLSRTLDDDYSQGRDNKL